MRKSVVMSALVCVVLILATIGTACSKTDTVTVTLIQTRTQNQTATVPTTIITTITQTFGGEVQETVVTLAGVPPMIPHPIDVVQGLYGTCFQCHPIPAGHTGRLANETTCIQCHDLGPVDPNLVNA